jgi:isocitrate lyase
MTTRELEVQRIRKDWAENARWKGVKRGYTAEDVIACVAACRSSTPSRDAARKSSGASCTSAPS